MLTPLSLAISCVATSVFIERAPYPLPGRPHQLTLSSDPARLAATDLNLSVKITYRLAETSGERLPWSASTVAYRYTIADRNGREIVAYHWHPDGRVTIPHLHLGATVAEGRLRPDFAGAHLPIGHVSLQEVLRLTIAELGVRPLRPDWDEVLHQSQ